MVATMAAGSRWAPPSGSGTTSSTTLEAQEVLAREPEGPGGLGGLVAALPEDRGAALGRDHRVVRVLAA